MIIEHAPVTALSEGGTYPIARNDQWGESRWLLCLVLEGEMRLSARQESSPVLSGSGVLLERPMSSAESAAPEYSPSQLEFRHARILLVPSPDSRQATAEWEAEWEEGREPGVWDGLALQTGGEAFALPSAILGLLQAVFYPDGEFVLPSPGLLQATLDSLPKLLCGLLERQEEGSVLAPPLARQRISPAEADAQTGDPLTDRALLLLGAEPELDWSLELLQERTGQDKRKIAGAFRKHGLLPPLQQLAKIRIALACRLLEENEQTIAQIAGRTGYADVAGFSHFFRRHTGKSPRQYRQDAAWLS